MSSFLKSHELARAAALFTLCSLVFFASSPAHADQIFNGDFANQAASQGTDPVGTAFIQSLSNFGLGILEAYGIIFVVILVLAFQDGNSRDREERLRNEKKTETEVRDDSPDQS